jgi:carboxymethylenebutenolidase
MGKVTQKEIHIGDIPAYIVEPASVGADTGAETGTGRKYPGLILLEEIWGVDAHIKDVSDRLSREGYVVVSPELLAETGVLEKISPAIFADMQDPEKRHAAQALMRDAMQPLSTPEFAEKTSVRLAASFDYLIKHSRVNGSIGILGFCFGGTYSFHLATQEPRLKACIVFYGQGPSPIESAANITCPVLGLYGEKDERLVSALPALTESMKKYGKDFTSIIYPNTGHAFFNDTRKDAYNKAAAEDSWKKLLEFLKKNLV